MDVDVAMGLVPRSTERISCFNINFEPMIFSVFWGILFVFTALHAMLTRSSDENYVCPSVCQTREL